MSLTIQITTIGGKIIEKARWKLASLGPVQTGHMVAVCIDSSNKNLLSHVRKQTKPECSIDRKEDGSHYIVATCVVKQIRHLLDGEALETMCILTPVNRHVEQVILYVFDHAKCSSRFVEAVKQS